LIEDSKIATNDPHFWPQMILLSGKNWGTVQRQQTGIKKMLDSFDPEEKRFMLMSKQVDA
jgi:hypothetical protein